jgi:hypothetical protein
MSFWCIQFPPKNERKQVDLRFHSSKVEFVRSFFGGNVYLKKSFRHFLTFRYAHFNGITNPLEIIVLLRWPKVLILSCSDIFLIGNR